MQPGHGVPAITVPQPPIRPRRDWAGSLRATGPLEVEKPGDSRFILIHHTVTPNGDRADQTPTRLRAIFRFHTGPKGWPDVAYNFFVDAHGTIWEGRTGSIEKSVKGDATGGSQGFAVLCCFVGDHHREPPTPQAMEAMAHLIAWLAQRESISLKPGTKVSFVSRGSNKWRRGSTVVTAPVAGHRDMSSTECPGNALYPLVASQLWPRAAELAGALPQPTPTPTPSGGTPPVASAPASPALCDPPPRAPVAGISPLWWGGGFGGLVVAGLGLVLAGRLANRGRSGEQHDEQPDAADDERA